MPLSLCIVLEERKGVAAFSIPDPTCTIVGSRKLHKNSQSLAIFDITPKAHNDQCTLCACSRMKPAHAVAHAPYGFPIICRKKFLKI